MKRKFNWLRTMNIALSGLLVLLGFSACANKEEVMPLMYGTLNPTYALKGKVINKEEQPVSKIQIIVKRKHSKVVHPNDTLYTNQEGEFLFLDYMDTDSYWVMHRDLRNKNITYKTDSVFIEPKNHFEEITIELTEKKNDEE